MMEETRMVLNRPRKESAMKAPRIGRKADAPSRVEVFGSRGSRFMEFVCEVGDEVTSQAAMPKKANLSSISTTETKKKKKRLIKKNSHSS